MNLLFVFLSLALCQSPICTPTAVSPPFSSSVWTTGASLRSHFIIAHPYNPPWNLSAVEWATGIRTDIRFAGAVDSFDAAPNKVGFVFHSSNGSLFSARSPLELPIQVNPPGVSVSFDAFAFEMFKISPDSNWIIFRDQSGSNVSGLYSVPFSSPNGTAAVRISDPAHVTFGVSYISPNSQIVLYTTVIANVTRLFSVPMNGSSLPVELSVNVTAGVGVDQFAIAFSEDSSLVVYASNPYDTVPRRKRLFVVSSSGPSSSAVEVSLSGALASGSLGYSGGLEFAPDKSLIIYRGAYEEYSRRPPYLRWFAANTSVANSTYPISVPSTAAVSNFYAQVRPRGLAYVGAVPNATARRSLYLVDIYQNADALGVNGTKLSLDANIGSVQSVLPHTSTYLGYTGDLQVASRPDLFFVPATGPANLSAKVNPSGPVDTVLSSGPLIVFRVGFRTFYTANVTSGTLVGQAISLPNQTLQSLFPSADSVSAIFFTSNASEAFVTCLIPPVIVLGNQSLVVNTTGPPSVPGHLILQSPTSAIAFVPGAATVNVGGVAVLNSGVLSLTSCQTGNYSILNASFIVGTFGVLQAQNCDCRSYSASAQYSTSSVTLSLIVDQSTPTCPPGAGGVNDASSSSQDLSVGAKVGIAVGSIAAGIGIVLVGVAIYKGHVARATALANAELRAQELERMPSMSLTPNPHNQ